MGVERAYTDGDRLAKIAAVAEDISRSLRLLGDAGIPLDPQDLYDLAAAFEQMRDVALRQRPPTLEVLVRPRLRLVT